MSFISSLFSQPKAATYTPPAVVSPTPTTSADPSIGGAGAAQRTAAGAASGLASTIKTSAEGAAAAPTALKSLLGS